MIKIFQEVKPTTHMPYKGYAVICTSEGNSDRIKEIIEELDPTEYKSYGCPKGEFVIPVVETLKPISESGGFENTVNVNTYDGGYYGKFEMDLEKLYQRCDEENIPIYIRINSYGDLF